MNVGANQKQNRVMILLQTQFSLTLILSMEMAGGGGYSFNHAILVLYKSQRENFASHLQPFAEIGSQILLFFSNPDVCISKTLSSGARSCKNNARYELTGATAERQNL